MRTIVPQSNQNMMTYSYMVFAIKTTNAIFQYTKFTMPEVILMGCIKTDTIPLVFKALHHKAFAVPSTDTIQVKENFFKKF